MKFSSILGGVFFALCMIGCASVQQNIPLSKAFYQEKGKKIGIIYTPSAVAETEYMGSIGLLDYGIISAANSGLDSHLKTLEFPEYQVFVDGIKPKLESHGFQVVKMAKPLTDKERKLIKNPKEGKSKSNFKKYKEDYGLDYVLLVNFIKIGTTRSYYGPAPTSEPVGMASINAQIVDLHSNDLVWYNTSYATKLIQAPWDESSLSYPNLTNSVYQSLDDSLRILNMELANPTQSSGQVVSSPK